MASKKRDRLAECAQSCREGDKSVPRSDLEWAIREIRKLRKAIELMALAHSHSQSDFGDEGWEKPCKCALSFQHTVSGCPIKAMFR